MKPRRLRTCIAHRAHCVAKPTAPGEGWRPLTLAWRRAPRRLAPGNTPRARTILQQHFHSYSAFQFNWSAAASGPVTRVGAMPGPSPSRVSRSHTLVELTRRESHRSYSRSLQLESRRSASTRREILERTRSFIHAPAPLIARRPPPAALPSAPKLAASLAPRTTVPSRERPRAPLEHTRAARVLRADAPPSAPPAKRISPPTPLVWRKLPPAAAAVTADRHDTPAAQEPLIERPTTKTAVAPAPPMIPAQQLREAVRANVMDAAVMDRLADDVLKRVEKRMRIERERRGL